MARRAHSPTPAIPKVAFEKVNDDEYSQPAGVHDLQARSYGYNGFNHFQLPEHYIRYIEPLDIELTKQVEYDMDEQDQEWLDAVNQERKQEQVDKVSYEVFEIIMDRLEKEWFDLTKNIPKPDMALPSEDSTCAICDDAEGENSNAIVFCDGCNLAVHQDCYGVPYIPEGQWLCRKCTVSPENPVSCILCPNEGGAFKQTTNGEWAHLLCAIWVPETRVANDTLMEPITGVDRINKQRWKLKCSLCRTPKGACIQCSKSSCFLAFHATCARKQKLLMPMKVAQGAESATLSCFCEKHLPKEQLVIHEAAMAALDEEHPSSDFDGSTPRAAKKARAYAKTYKLGPPLVPAIIVNHIMEYIGRIHIRKKLDFVQLVCRYWSLKREARRGAPLLKRLHLSPWSGATGKAQTEEELAVKLDLLKRLRKDLEAVRMLAELVRKREAQKQKQAQIINDLVSNVLFPHVPHLYNTLEKFEALDRTGYFKNPVSRTEVPDYFDVIKKPMCWKNIEAKLDANDYWNVKDFEDDVNLVLDNAIVYNKPDTAIYKTAMRIKNNSLNILGELHQFATSIPSDSPEVGRVGDLEAPLSVLDLLTSIENIEPDLDFILMHDALESMFTYELEEPKLLPTPPPPMSTMSASSANGRRRKPPKGKRDRKAEAERRRQRQLDASAGFRGPPRTRKAHARAEAFEAEARAGVEDAAADLEDDDDESAFDSEGKIGSHGRRWKRTSIVLPGQADVPPVVEDIDKQRSFSMFDEGWILPSGIRRGGRAPVERHDGPPPRKKTRSDRQNSTLSNSTPAEENHTLAQNVAAEEEEELPHKREKSITVDLSESFAQADNAPELFIDTAAANVELPSGADTELRELAVGSDLELVPTTAASESIMSPRSNRRRSPRPQRKVEVIEQLDTPAIRRGKNLARKQRRLEELARQAREAGQQPGAASVAVLEPVEPLSGLNSAGTMDSHSRMSSPLSALTDMDEDANADGEENDDPSAEVRAKSADETDISGSSQRSNSVVRRPNGQVIVSAAHARKAAAEEGLGPVSVVLKDDELLESGTLVWAKAETYPWWPAVVFEEDHPDVPSTVLESKDKSPRGNGPLLLVQFMDARDSWQWLRMDKVKLLNENEAWDAIMLNGDSKNQRFKNAKAKDNCRAAYRRAIAEMETSNVGSELTSEDQATSSVADASSTGLNTASAPAAMKSEADEAVAPEAI